MDKSEYRQRLEQILNELREKQNFVNLFRDRRPGYIEGYADALSEMMIKIRMIGLLLGQIANDEDASEEESDEA